MFSGFGESGDVGIGGNGADPHALRGVGDGFRECFSPARHLQPPF